jgi:AsmA family protein
MALTPRTRAALRWTGIVVGVIVALLLLTLALIDWSSLKGPIERYASERSGRQVSIAGDLDVRVWSWTPSATVEGLTIGSAPWDKSRPMAQIERVTVQLKLLPLLKGEVILPRVDLIRPRVYLHRDVSGRANWTFESQRPTNAPAGPPPDLPTVRDFLIQDGTLVLRDDIRHLEVEGTVHAREKSSQDDPEAFRIQAKGKLNNKPFAMRVTGGPLINLDPDKPYPFGLDIEAGDIRIAADGSVRKPFDLARVKLDVRASGGDLADLYYLTQLALPNTPPFQLAASIERNGKKVHVTNLAGKVGKSDMGGDLLVDLSRKRPFVSGHLDAKRLVLSDLAAPLGAKPNTAGTIGGKTSPARPSKKGAEEAPPDENARLFPVARLQVNRVRVMDGNVRFRAQSVEARSLPLKGVAFDIKLNEGMLSLDPFAFELPQGKVAGTLRIDARGKTPQTRLDLRMKDLQLDQLKGKKPGSQPPLGGVVQARALFNGKGDSVHDFMADADGQVSLVLPQGEVRAAFAELTGINVARGVGLLLKGDNERANIRCGVAQFVVRDGTMRAQNVVFDTEDVRITGRGEVRLGPEELDLSIKGEPKKLRLARLRTPVEINGHLRKPAIGIDAGKTVKQGAVAAALGALAPVAAVLAFIDPGLAKDENCRALLSTAQSATPESAPIRR